MYASCLKVCAFIWWRRFARNWVNQQRPFVTIVMVPATSTRRLKVNIACQYWPCFCYRLTLLLCQRYNDTFSLWWHFLFSLLEGRCSHEAVDQNKVFFISLESNGCCSHTYTASYFISFAVLPNCLHPSVLCYQTLHAKFTGSEILFRLFIIISIFCFHQRCCVWKSADLDARPVGRDWTYFVHTNEIVFLWLFWCESMLLARCPHSFHLSTAFSSSILQSAA